MLFLLVVKTNKIILFAIVLFLASCSSIEMNYCECYEYLGNKNYKTEDSSKYCIRKMGAVYEKYLASDGEEKIKTYRRYQKDFCDKDQKK